MKLILENWRKFVENQQPITLDESQLLPEILKFDLNEELLNEVDTDPEAMSVDELREIPADEIIRIYDQMIPKQTKADIAGDRASKRAQMSGELRKTSAELDKYQKTGFFSKIVNSAKVVMNDIFNTDYEAFDKKSVEEGSQKQANRKKKMTNSTNGKPKKKNVFQEILDEIEKEKKRKEQASKQVYTKPKTKKNKTPVTSEKEDWKFGEDELKTSQAAHKRHHTEFVPSSMDNESSEADLIAEEFDLKKAVIYSEIMNRPYAD